MTGTELALLLAFVAVTICDLVYSIALRMRVRRNEDTLKLADEIIGRLALHITKQLNTDNLDDQADRERLARDARYLLKQLP